MRCGKDTELESIPASQDLNVYSVIKFHVHIHLKI